MRVAHPALIAIKASRANTSGAENPFFMPGSSEQAA
jgi:hypothetical protein